MNFEEYATRRELLELLAKHGVPLAWQTLDGWRRKPAYNFPQAIRFGSGAVLFERAAVSAWAEAFKLTPRFELFRRRQASRWSLEQTARILSQPALNIEPPGPAKKRTKAKSEQPSAGPAQ